MPSAKEFAGWIFLCMALLTVAMIVNEHIMQNKIHTVFAGM
jgi:hypothetical protein